jgi:ATP-dependent exoDNAse (exonuclease V) beta subunit
MTTRPRRSQTAGVVWVDDTWMLAGKGDDGVFVDHLPIDEQMSDAERRRLLYVACTRAIDHLVVSLHRVPPKPEKAANRMPSATLLASVGAAWEWVSVAPKPDRLATVLRTALQQQGKKIWQTNLPKEVRLKVDEAVTGPNPTHDAFIDFDDDPERFRSRNYFRVRGPEASEIWRTRTIRDAVLAIGKLVGVAH